MEASKIVKERLWFVLAIAVAVVVLGGLIVYMYATSANNNGQVAEVASHCSLAKYRLSPACSRELPSYLPNPTPKPSPTPTPISNPNCPSGGKAVSDTACITLATNGLAKYTDSEYGFSFEYPDTLLYGLSEDNGNSMNFHLSETFGAPGSINIGVFREPMSTLMTTLEANSQIATTLNGATVPAKASDVTLGGHSVEVFNDMDDYGDLTVDYLFDYKDLSFDITTDSRDANLQTAVESIISSLK